MNPASIAPGAWSYILPIILLVCSNLFMTIAWYGHLKYKSVALVTVVLVSWGIAFVEYCFAVPANRFGSAVYSPAELKTSVSGAATMFGGRVRPPDGCHPRRPGRG